jgi:hypothetical protein
MSVPSGFLLAQKKSLAGHAATAGLGLSVQLEAHSDTRRRLSDQVRAALVEHGCRRIPTGRRAGCLVSARDYRVPFFNRRRRYQTYRS